MIGAIVMSVAASTMTGEAHATGYPWRGHAAPYDFLFGNEIDTHQQTREASDGALSGFLYVHYTGAVTSDGLAVAEHDDCATTTCDVGWTIDALPATGTFLYHPPDDHPVWLVKRPDIPQPGAYAHFHWYGPVITGEPQQGYLLELRAVARFCFVHHDAGASGDGSCRARGGVAVVPGIDIATHVNIVTSAP
jgi:hypothetical protein